MLSLLLFSRVPLDMMHISESTAAEFAEDYDCHGDSYYDDTDVDGLKKSFDRIEPQVILIQLIQLFTFALLNTNNIDDDDDDDDDDIFQPLVFET